MLSLCRRRRWDESTGPGVCTAPSQMLPNTANRFFFLGGTLGTERALGRHDEKGSPALLFWSGTYPRCICMAWGTSGEVSCLV